MGTDKAALQKALARALSDQQSKRKPVSKQAAVVDAQLVKQESIASSQIKEEPEEEDAEASLSEKDSSEKSGKSVSEKSGKSVSEKSGKSVGFRTETEEADASLSEKDSSEKSGKSEKEEEKITKIIEVAT